MDLCKALSFGVFPNKILVCHISIITTLKCINYKNREKSHTAYTKVMLKKMPMTLNHLLLLRRLLLWLMLTTHWFYTYLNIVLLAFLLRSMNKTLLWLLYIHSSEVSTRFLLYDMTIVGCTCTINILWRMNTSNSSIFLHLFM